MRAAPAGVVTRYHLESSQQNVSLRLREIYEKANSTGSNLRGDLVGSNEIGGDLEVTRMRREQVGGVLNLSEHEVLERVRSAYREFLQHDRDLLVVDANERSLTHKLAEHLQLQFPEWKVDCEYNRSGSASTPPKTLPEWKLKRIRLDDTDARTVFPDIIVHKRGTDENLLVIEAKKSTTSEASEDEAKLRGYFAEHRYRNAFLVVFPVFEAAGCADAVSDIQVVTP